MPTDRVFVKTVLSCLCLSIGLRYDLGVSSISVKTAERKPGDAINVTCNFPTAIDRCGARVFLETFRRETPDTDPMDFSAGKESPVLDRKSNGNFDNFKGTYLGDGLDKGDCGVTLSALTEGRYFVQCRVHVVGGEWHSEFMSMVVHPDGFNDKELSFFKNQTVNPSTDSEPVEFIAPNNLEECQLFLPDSQEAFSLSQGQRNKTAATYKASLDGRKCTVTLTQVTLRATGPIWALYREAGEKMWKAFPPQIVNVIENPGPANFVVEASNETRSTLKCSVPAALPAAQIRWVVEGKEVRFDQDSEVEVWAWPWSLQSVSQRLTMKAATAKQTVACIIYHPNRSKQVQTLSQDIAGLAPSTTTATPTVPSGGGTSIGTTTATTTQPSGDDAGGLEHLWWLLILPIAVAAGLVFRFFKGLPLCWSAVCGEPPQKLVTAFSCCSDRVLLGAVKPEKQDVRYEVEDVPLGRGPGSE